MNIPGTDDGKGEAAHFNLPTQIAADPNGSRLFVTDTNNSIIRMIQVPDMMVKTIAGQSQVEGKVDGPREQIVLQPAARNRDRRQIRLHLGYRQQHHPQNRSFEHDHLDPGRYRRRG